MQLCILQVAPAPLTNHDVRHHSSGTVYRKRQPVATAPGSVFVDPRLPNYLLTRPRSLKGLCIAGWVRSLSLPVPYSSTHVAELFAYAAARALGGRAH